MLIEEYFQQLREVIEACTLVQSFNLIPDKRGDSEGFIRGVIKLTDSSILYLREFVNVETTINREMYSYQYMDASNNIIFRYDNVEHHKKLNLPNYPHHKHDGSEDNVISSNAPMLADVLDEIATLLG
ncbi:DUF6516 family protein [Aerosakkonemataceae cyanobacterium BLCC-F154]|uniref:DUF6516 family protein n=1 Tax=Floridaenema fluviatile BLCC-F154 TaxID=3153640 RepID=A0ABV4YAX4_9CYAN